MASNVRQTRTLEAYCCLRGLENEVTSDFCLAPFCAILLVGARTTTVVARTACSST